MDQLSRMAAPSHLLVAGSSTATQTTQVELDSATCESLLVREIDITKSDDCLTMVLRGLETDISTKLVLSNLAVSEWLLQLDHCFDLARWSKIQWQRSGSKLEKMGRSSGSTVH